MIQQRQGGNGDQRWHSPDRDLAYCWQSLVQSTADGLAETSWEEWFKDYFKHTGLTEEQIGQAFVVYVTAISYFPDPDIRSPREAMEKAGWFNLPEAAQVALCMKLGQVVTCAFFSAIRDVTIEGEAPSLNASDMLKAGRSAQEQMGRKTWVPGWIRKLIRRYIA